MKVEIAPQSVHLNIEFTALDIENIRNVTSFTDPIIVKLVRAIETALGITDHGSVRYGLYE